MRSLVLVAFGSLVLLWASGSFAQDSDAARARAAFDEAISLAERGEWVMAIQLFEDALALRDAPAIRFNLAQSLSHVGRYVDALAQLDALETAGAAPPELQRSAEGLREQVAPRIGRIVVRVRGDAEGLMLQVGERDARPVAGELNAASDPGRVEVRLLRGAEVLDELAVSVAEGGVTHVVLTAAPSVSAPPAGDEQIEGDLASSASTDEDIGGAWWLWTIVAVVALGVAGGVAAAVVVAHESAPQPSAGDFDPPFIQLGLAGHF